MRILGIHLNFPSPTHPSPSQNPRNGNFQLPQHKIEIWSWSTSVQSEQRWYSNFVLGKLIVTINLGKVTIYLKRCFCTKSVQQTMHRLLRTLEHWKIKQKYDENDLLSYFYHMIIFPQKKNLFDDILKDKPNRVLVKGTIQIIIHFQP